jgi:hypothetical protein
MKFTKSSYNPLREILELFPLEAPMFVTTFGFEQFNKLLKQGGIHCASQPEMLKCLEVLQSLGVLEVEQVTHSGSKYLKIGNKLNGKVTQQNS